MAETIADLEVLVRANTKALDQAQRAITQAGQTMERTARRFEQSSRRIEQSLSKVQRGGRGAARSAQTLDRQQAQQVRTVGRLSREFAVEEQRLRQLIQVDRRFANELATLTRSMRSLQRATSNTTLTQTELARRTERFRNTLAGVRQRTRDVGVGVDRLGRRSGRSATKTGRLNKVIRDLQSASVLAVGPLSGIGARIQAVGSIASRSALLIAGLFAVIAGTTVAIVAFSVGTIKAAKDFEKFERILRVATGSLAQAKEEMEFVIELSDDLAVSIQESVKGFASFSAATQGTRLEGEATREIFTSIQQASAALGLSAADTSGILTAFTQVVSKGNVQAEELRGQIGERLPGAFGLAAKALGVTTSELDKMLRNGEVLADDLLPKLARELTRRFGAEAERNIESLAGSVQNLKNQFTRLFDVIAKETAVGEFISNVLNKIASAIASVRKQIKETVQEEVDRLREKEARLRERAGQRGARGAEAGKQLREVRAQLAVLEEILRTRERAAPKEQFFSSEARVALTDARDLLEDITRSGKVLPLDIETDDLREVAELQAKLAKEEARIRSERQFTVQVDERLAELAEVQVRLAQRRKDLLKELAGPQVRLETPEQELQRFRARDPFAPTRPFVGLDKFERAATEFSDINRDLARMEQLAGASAIQFAEMEKRFERNDKLREFREELEDLQQALRLSDEDIDRLVKRLDTTLDRFEENKRRVKLMNDVANLLEQSFDRITGAMTDAIVAGEDFGDTMRRALLGVVSEVQNLILKLAIVNPLLNRLTGGERPTLDLLLQGRPQAPGQEAAQRVVDANKELEAGTGKAADKMDNLSKTTQGVGDALVGFGNRMGDFLSELANGFLKLFSAMSAGGGGGRGFLSALLSGIGGFVPGVQAGTAGVQFAQTGFAGSAPAFGAGTVRFRGFQHGGSFTVPGPGGLDSRLVQFMASPGEQVEVMPPQLQPSTAGGGDVNIIMDFRGVSGSEEIELRVRRAISEAAPSIVNASIDAVRNSNARSLR